MYIYLQADKNIVFLLPLIRLDSDFVRAYGWIEPIGSNRSLPPVANHLYDLKYTAGKGKIPFYECF